MDEHARSLHNDRNRPLTVPGFNDCSIYLELISPDRFAHGANDWRQAPNITAREVAMLRLMNSIIEQPGWHEEIFDIDSIAAIRQKALARELISTAAWDWCLAELQDKAIAFVETSRVTLLNTGLGVSISTSPTLSTIVEGLRSGLGPLLHQLQGSEQVTHLVDPSLYPLVYGRSHVITQGGQVNFNDLSSSYGFADDVPPYVGPTWDDSNLPAESLDPPPGWAYDHLKLDRFSARFQWLPADTEFTSDGDEISSVRIVSYINNLHPDHNAKLYHAIEKLIGLAIEPWNDILVKGKRGRWPTRIKTFGVEWRSDHPSPENSPFMHPEPGQSFTYEQWKTGDTAASIIGPSPDLEQVDCADYSRCEQPHDYYRVNLRDEFRADGLQVIVQITSIDLTPDNQQHTYTPPQNLPTSAALLNNHIVATALIPISSSNIHPARPRITFSQETDLPPHPSRTSGPPTANPETAMGRIFSVAEIDTITSGEAYMSRFPAVEEVGSVATPIAGHGMMVWPTAFRHFEEGFTLRDASKAGHWRYVMLYLVDPHYRVCSTRNVPPQQHDWWAAEALKAVAEAASLTLGHDREGCGRTLPPEILRMIDERTGDWPMGVEEAVRLRDELAEESRRVQMAIERETNTYDFYDLE